MGGGALDRYYVRVLSLYKRNPLTLLQEGIYLNIFLTVIFYQITNLVYELPYWLKKRLHFF